MKALHIQDIEKSNDNCQTKIAELEEKLEIAVDALEFYGAGWTDCMVKENMRALGKIKGGS